ncbi:hypothetical protein IC229_27985 [Spirosoma sp. BT702]|uniref:Uncharacterized protein n=1 Tax=Spirosoma profusum TaxID=2771354 RepID=A0A926Y0U4_9BACT|nr:hypothetical protein [Spirosoma profusum]MBD2704513.1 hypothetical protein [Spirosoma profusum]
MKTCYAISILYLLSQEALAQTNYVANIANAASPGNNSTLLGPGAGGSGSLTGDRNTFTGFNAGYSLTDGYWNSFYGMDAGKFTTTGKENVFTGYEAGLNNTGELLMCL